VCLYWCQPAPLERLEEGNEDSENKPVAELYEPDNDAEQGDESQPGED